MGCVDMKKESKRWMMDLLTTAELLTMGGHEGMARGDARC